MLKLEMANRSKDCSLQGSLSGMQVLAGERSHTLSSSAITNDQWCNFQVVSVNVITYSDSLSFSCSWVPVNVQPPTVVAIETTDAVLNDKEE